jgi:hypothetical protein
MPVPAKRVCVVVYTPVPVPDQDRSKILGTNLVDDELLLFKDRRPKHFERCGSRDRYGIVNEISKIRFFFFFFD